MVDTEDYKRGFTEGLARGMLNDKTGEYMSGWEQGVIHGEMIREQLGEDGMEALGEAIDLTRDEDWVSKHFAAVGSEAAAPGVSD